MTRRDDAPGALPAHRGAAHDQAHRDDPVGRDPGSEAERVAGPDLPRQTMADLVAAATMAPSMHNTQPWRFRFTAGQPDDWPVRRPGTDAAVW